MSLQGEKLSADATAIDPFKRKLQEVMEKGLTLEQLYNCDETGLYYRMLPAKTLASRYEKGAEGMEKQKDCVTLMACSNATGNHKLPLVLIGKSANPRCFKNINKAALPVKYCAQKSAWMNSNIFSDWFINIFVPKYLHDKNLPVKAILLLDNATAHPSTDVLQSSDKSVTAMYLPANTTSLIQPMDQGVLETIKRHYKRDLLRKLQLLDEDGHSINMKDVVYTSAASWGKLPL